MKNESKQERPIGACLRSPACITTVLLYLFVRISYTAKSLTTELLTDSEPAASQISQIGDKIICFMTRSSILHSVRFMLAHEEPEIFFHFCYKQVTAIESI